MQNEHFTLFDYIIFISLLLISFIIGIITAFKGNKTPEDYLLGNRSLHPVPVAMSLLTSFISAVNIVGYSAEVYMYGTQLSLISIGCMFGLTASVIFVIPVTYSLRLTSIHEYIEMRFHSSRLQILMMVLVFFNATVFMGIGLYATALSLAAVTPLNYQAFILIMGLVCTIYSTLGGIRAVVWTDVFQLMVMVGGLLTLIIAGTYQLGGFETLFAISKEGNRLQFFNMNPSLYERHNFYNTLALGAFFYGAIFSVSQVNTQRISAVPTLQDAKKVLVINIFGMAFIHILMFLAGLVAYAFYAGCDPYLSGKIGKRDEILSFLMVDKLGHFYGLPGIFVATLISSTISSFSSIVNALVALVWKDALCKIKIFSNARPFTATLINKILTVMIGGGFIGMAFLASKATSIIQLSLSVGGIIFGSIFGVFLLGMCIPFSNLKGAWCGMIGSIMLTIWIYIGALRNNSPPEMLPFTTDFCDNRWAANSTLNNNTLVLTNVRFSLDRTNEYGREENSPLMYLYGISYTLYPVIGPFLCIAIGAVVSKLTGDVTSKVDSKLISPIVLKLCRICHRLTQKINK